MEATNMAICMVIQSPPKENLTKYSITNGLVFSTKKLCYGTTTLMRRSPSLQGHGYTGTTLMKKKHDIVGVKAATTEAVVITGIAEVTIRLSNQVGLFGWIDGMPYYNNNNKNKNNNNNNNNNSNNNSNNNNNNKQAAEFEGGVTIQIISTETHSENIKVSKEAVLRWQDSHLRSDGEEKKLSYRVKVTLDSNFGVPTAIFVRNNYNEEFFLESINFQEIIHFQCNSWIQPQNIYPNRRIFLSNKVCCLPNKTPRGLHWLREEELMEMRGDGKGLRRQSDRIYDFDVYNDLGHPDKGIKFARPTFGGLSYSYPRRLRTGRPPTNIDSGAESVVSDLIPMYVPRDEQFSDSKKEAIEWHQTKGKLRNVIPQLIHVATPDAFKVYPWVNSYYKEQNLSQLMKFNQIPLLNAFNNAKGFIEDIIKFDPPNFLPRDSFILRDDEFGRLPLAGINSLNIEKLKVFPPRSKLDPSMYGPQDSMLTEEHIIGNLNGMSVQQAIDENKLFILDYHDTYFPLLEDINSQTGNKAHATRTIFLLTEMGTLKPIAIELSLPQQPKQVVLPPVDSTSYWLWQLAKAHVSANDSGVHQLVNHWLRTHACMEPFIISAHRQLSVMHPVYKLLYPHMKDTLQVNAMSREYLINAQGIVEDNLTSGQYSMLLSSTAYRHWWRFDLESLPADLIRRGVAIADPNQPHGIKLVIEDYPYANDGLLVWSAIEELVKTYVNYYYSDATSIQSDTELQNWYNESINVGHEDLRHAIWWPNLNTPEDLVLILSIIIWVASAQHASLNFGQYQYGGYVPTRPPLMRRLVPTHQHHNDTCYNEFMTNPQEYYLTSLPSLFQATRFTAIIHILSAHPPDEDYLGQRDLSTWSSHPQILDAFFKFSMEMNRIQQIIDQRNHDVNLRNRCGAGVPPYELFMPSSGPGVTSKGIPNSISI